MWDTLEILHEATKDVKQYKINNPRQKYEFFHINQGETIASM